MKILFATSEVYPFLKTGGLADVSASLPVALHKLGVDIRLVLPAYGELLAKHARWQVAALWQDPQEPEPTRVLQGTLPGSDVLVYLIDTHRHFSRRGNPYLGYDGRDWPDNAARFAHFNRAATALALDQVGLDWRADLVHCNDWQTGLIPVLLKLTPPPVPPTLCTIHNLAYQGVFSHAAFTHLSLPAHLWSLHGVEFYGQFSFLKAGLQFADWLTTVSPTYAQEIQQAELGYGLDGLLRARQHQLSGILNGVDYAAWDPRHDPLLPRHYSPENLAPKRLLKQELQAEFALAPEADTPLMAYIGRMAWQKGVDLILTILPELIAQGVQIIIQGSGESQLEHAFTEAMERYPEQLGVYIGYNETLAHRIEAGADMFLMPSRYEPCGLNQLYSLRYGTVPIVRRTGGLSDTVVDTDLISAVERRASGFVFNAAQPEALLEAAHRALAIYRRAPVWWEQIMLTGMQQDFSWEVSAHDYHRLYRQLTAKQPF